MDASSFLSSNVKMIYKSATEPQPNNLFTLEEIKMFVDMKDLTCNQANLEQTLEAFLKEVVDDATANVISEEKVNQKDITFYGQILKSLCPIFYMFDQATYAYQNEKTIVESANSRPNVNDVLISWVSEEEIIKGIN